MWPTNWSVPLPSWAVSNSLQKRLVKFLLRRTVGQFLKTELDDANLDVQLSSGQVQLKNVELSEEALNDAISGLPLVVRSGAIGKISVSVPWTQLWTGHCELQIEELVIQTELVSEGTEGESAAEEMGQDNRLRSGRANIAESVVMTEGGASILTSSVFIADDFLRGEALGYGEKDEIFINKDVERMVANAHEERAQYYRSRSRSSGGHAAGRFPWASDAGQKDSFSPGVGKGKGNGAGADTGEVGGDEYESGRDLPPAPSSPGGSVRGLQVVSEMVDRIISAVNIRVRHVRVECAVPGHEDGKAAGAAAGTTTLQLTLDSAEFRDEAAHGDTAKSATTSLRGKSSGDSSSSHLSGDGSGNGSDHPAGIEYKVVEFHTLSKLVELKGLRLSMLTQSEGVEPSPATVLSSFSAPILAHLRLHRRLPFSELAPVQPTGSGSSRRRSSNSESVYMGPMPGEFREMKPEQASSTAAAAATADSSRAGIRSRNRAGEEPTASGWDVSVELGDIACILTTEQLGGILAIANAVASLVKQKTERRAMRDRYQEKYGDIPLTDAGDPLPQLAQWVSVKCRHLYVAVLANSTGLYQGWQDGSLAVIRLKLETEKHLALYLKRIGVRWESAPVSGVGSTPSGSPTYMDTEFWAAMTRESAAQMGGKQQSSSGPVPRGGCLATVSAFVQNISVYDNDPQARPVVLPLVTIDRSLTEPSRSTGQRVPKPSERNSDKYDIWMCASETDLVLAVNVGPIIITLNKELADRLTVYRDIISSIVPSSPPQQAPASSLEPAAAGTAGSSDSRYANVTASIDDLMGSLKLQAEQRMPSNVALCSPLIRAWVLLPSTATVGTQAQQRHRHSHSEGAAPGHFCVDAVDAVITNVVNGTATSSQVQDGMPDGHMRHPHIQELLESRKSVAGSGVRLECEALQIYIQSMEGSSAVSHISSVHGPSSIQSSFHEAVSIPRPHIEITTVAKALKQLSGFSDGAAAHRKHRPPAFDAFSAVDDDIRVRMAPESELTTSIEFERQAVALSRLVISCHLPEAEIILSKPAYQRLHAVINEFLLWQSVQEELREASMHDANDAAADRGDSEELCVSVIVDVPLMLATISTSDTQIGDDAIGVEIPSMDAESYSNTTQGHHRHHHKQYEQQQHAISQRIRLANTRLFLSNAAIEKGRMYVSVESNQVRLSSFEGETEAEVTLSHSFATLDAPIITPQLSLYMLTSPSMSEESEVVVKTTWTTFDFSRDSSCLRDLEAFFSSSGTSGLVQPPPKPMHLSLNVLNSSFRWSPADDPGLRSAAISLDSLAVIVGLNSPAPDRDREELHYYVEGLSVYGKSTDSLISTPVHVSSDAWVSTGRFWKDHGYTMLLHTDMVDLASKSKEGEEGPLLDLRLYGEALILDACADSIGTLPQLLRGLARDIQGEANSSKAAVAEHRGWSGAGSGADKSTGNPHVLGQVTDDIFGDIEEDTFALAPEPYERTRNLPASPSQRSSYSHAISPLSTEDYSFTYDFEHGRDDISALVMDGYFAPHAQPDVAEEYEVVGGKSLSPTATMHPSYSRRSQFSGSGSHAGGSGQQTRHREQPSRGKAFSKGLAGKPLDIKASKGKAVDRGRDRQLDDDLEFNDYVNMDSTSDLSSEDEAGYSADNSLAGYSRHTGYHRQYSAHRYSGHEFATGDSVVLEPQSHTSHFTQHTPVDLEPRTELIDVASDGDDGPVKVSIPKASGKANSPPNRNKQRKAGARESAEGDFGIIDDYFAAPSPGEMSQGYRSSAEDNDHILCFTVDVARVEVNLHAGQDWYVSPEAQARHVPADASFLPSYLDDLNEAPGPMGGSVYGRGSVSMPESRSPIGHRMSPHGSPQSPRRFHRCLSRPARRSAKPKIELRAVHVHAEYKQFSEASSTAYDLGLSIGMLEIVDELESSEWSKFLTRRRDPKTGLPATLHSLANARNRQLLVSGTADSDRVTSNRMRSQGSGKWPSSNAEPMVCIQVESVRPYAALATEELRVDVEISPLRCYIHQDALDFLIGFFESAERHADTLKVSGQQQNSEAGKGGRAVGPRRHAKRASGAVDQPYFQIVRIAPLNVIFDYKPRRMRVSSTGSAASGGSRPGAGNQPQAGSSSPKSASPGGTSGAPAGSSRKPIELLNFFPLEDAEMTLSTVKVRGVAGVSKLVRELGGAWLPHLTQTQIPGVVSGMTPIRSLVNIGSGVADLIILPLEQYRKDGRLVQGIKRGAQSFARTTALEAIQLGAKVAVNAQTLLEQAGDILNVDVASGGESSSAPHSHDSRLESAGALMPPRGIEGAGNPLGVTADGQQQHIAVDLADWPDFASADGTEYGGDGRRDKASGSTRRRSFSASKYARQPENLSEGMRQAYASLRSNVGDAVQTILAIPVVVQEGVDEGDGGDGGGAGAPGRSPVHGSVRAVVRAVPVAVLKPMIGATEAVSKTLLGLRNTMEPARRGQLEDKYKSRGLAAKKSYPL